STDARRLEYTYDLGGNIIQTVSGIAPGNPTEKKVTTAYVYDALGRQVELDEAVGTAEARRTTMQYDAADRLIGTTTGLSAVANYAHPVETRYQYDELGRRTVIDEAANAAGSGQTTTARRTVVEYDTADNAVVKTITPLSFGATPRGWVGVGPLAPDLIQRTT